MRQYLLAAVVLASTGCLGTRVDETELCTETRFGNVVTPVMHKGWNWQVSPGLDATCFPATQQIYPGGWVETKDGERLPRPDVVRALTRDSVDMTVEYAFGHQIVPEFYYDSVFKTKREVERFEATIGNAAREGVRAAIGNIRSGDAFSNRERFGDSVRTALQRSVGGLTRIVRVYIRDIDLPPAVRQARERVYSQGIALDSVRKNRTIDSTNNVTRLQNANTEYEVNRVQAKVWENKAFADIEVKKAQYEAMGNICGEATTCIIGGNVLDKYMAGTER